MPPFNLVLPPSRGGNKRRQSRHPARGLVLTCTRVTPSRLHGGGQANLAIQLHDIGLGGLRFIALEALPPRTQLNLQIREEATGEEFHSRGEVVWVARRQADGRDVHLIGTRFDEILSAPARAAWFHERWAAAKRAPWEFPPTAPALKPRAGGRFVPSDVEVTLTPDPRFKQTLKSGPLEARLRDLSRSGAQVVCTEPLHPLDRMRITIDLRNFKEIFSAEAEAVWVRVAGPREWRVGLRFGALNRAQDRQLTTLEQWFHAR